MTRTKLFRRAAATLLAACMMFSLSAPALAEGADAALGGADDTVTVNDTVLSAAKPTLSIGNASITYDPVQHTVTNSGMVVDDLTVTVGAGAGDVDVILNAPEGALAVWGALTVEGARDVALTGSVGGPLIDKKAVIRCSGKLSGTNPAGSVFGGGLNVGDETTAGAAEIELSNGSTNMPCVTGAVLLNCTGSVKITSTDIAVAGPLKVFHAADVTVTGGTEQKPALTGAVNVFCTGTLTLKNESGMVVTGSLNVGDAFTSGAGSVEVIGGAGSPAFGGGLIHSTGTISLQSKGHEVSYSSLEIKGGSKVSIVGGNTYDPAVVGKLEIQECTGAVTLKNENGCVVKGDLYIGDESAVYPASIEVVGNGTDSAITGSALLNSTGDITITNKSGGAVGQDTTGHLIVNHAKNVTVTGSSTEAIIAETDASSYSQITCSGEAELYNKQGGPVFHQLRFANSEGRNCLWLIGKTPEDAEPMGTIPEGASYIRIAPFFKLTVVNGSPGENLNNPVQTIKGTDFEVSADLPDADDPNQYFDHWEVTCSEPVTIESLYQPTTTIIMPAADVTLTPVWTSVPPVVPGTPDSGSSSDVETVIVGAVLGGAAVWGGYEIATRIILKNLLPEGASIPADRGQLALLLWQHAGKPEPAAQPAFADVTDTEMAQAAQWCVEQGYLTAKNGAFDPDGWVPKAKTIQVWNRAFGGK